MIDFESELKTILETDPLGLLEIKPKKSSAASADERLATSFEEINSFVREHGREPTESRDVHERRLYSRLKGLRESPVKAEALTKFDTHNLLAELESRKPNPIETITDVLRDDVLGLLGESEAGREDPNEIFRLNNIPRPRATADLVAKRKPCEEFHQFEPLFKQWQADLKSGARVMVPFNSERQICPDRVFVLQGMLVYVANMGKWEKKNFGNVNARLYCVFENGTESNILLRSLAAAFWKDAGSRQVVEADQAHLFAENGEPNAEDEATGHIYVVRSLSSDPRIQEMENLFKIGFSSQSVDVRTQKAAQDPTFLMADVMPVAVFQTFNLNPQKLELLLHRFFAEACLNLDVFDGEGKRHTPREWFVVPFPVIETAIKRLINGDIVNYRYDSQRQEIVTK